LKRKVLAKFKYQRNETKCCKSLNSSYSCLNREEKHREPRFFKSNEILTPNQDHIDKKWHPPMVRGQNELKLPQSTTNFIKTFLCKTDQQNFGNYHF